jgi:hypothetical protein
MRLRRGFHSGLDCQRRLNSPAQSFAGDAGGSSGDGGCKREEIRKAAVTPAVKKRTLRRTAGLFNLVSQCRILGVVTALSSATNLFKNTTTKQKGALFVA